MRYTSHAPDRRKPSWPRAQATSERKSPAPRARFARRTIGFWLGGGFLGTAGCILGVCMPYQHPVAVMISVLWWGIYLGCFGARVGALIGLFTERAAASAPRGVVRRIGPAPATFRAASSALQEGGGAGGNAL